MKQLETLKLDQDMECKGIFIITLDREKALNAFNTQMAIDMIEILRYLKYQEEMRVLILTGSGLKSFCVGADLKERRHMTNNEWKKQHDIFEEAYWLLRNFEYPTIAAINGYALGGGLELALSCDFRTIHHNTYIGVPEVSIGILPGSGGTQLLPRLINIGLAKELLFSGKKINGKRAFEIGLVNHVLQQESIVEETLQIAREISCNAPLSLKAIKKAVNMGLQADLNTGISIELSQYYHCANSNDRLEGINAFNEKRSPVWSNT